MPVVGDAGDRLRHGAGADIAAVACSPVCLGALPKDSGGGVMCHGPARIGACTRKIANLINDRSGLLCGLRSNITRRPRRAILNSCAATKSGQCRDCGSGIQLIEQRLRFLQIECIEALGEPAVAACPDRARAAPCSSAVELIKQSLGLMQHRRVKPFSKPAVDRREQFARASARLPWSRHRRARLMAAHSSRAFAFCRLATVIARR